MPTVLRSERSARPSAGAACSRKRSRRASAVSASGISSKNSASRPTSSPSSSSATDSSSGSSGSFPTVFPPERAKRSRLEARDGRLEVLVNLEDGVELRHLEEFADLRPGVEELGLAALLLGERQRTHESP